MGMGQPAIKNLIFSPLYLGYQKQNEVDDFPGSTPLSSEYIICQGTTGLTLVKQNLWLQQNSSILFGLSRCWCIYADYFPTVMIRS